MNEKLWDALHTVLSYVEDNNKMDDNRELAEAAAHIQQWMLRLDEYNATH